MCCKHFAAYGEFAVWKLTACMQLLIYSDLENWNGTDRHHFNAIVPDQDLVEVIHTLCTIASQGNTSCSLMLMQRSVAASCSCSGVAASCSCSAVLQPHAAQCCSLILMHSSVAALCSCSSLMLMQRRVAASCSCSAILAANYFPTRNPMFTVLKITPPIIGVLFTYYLAML